MLAADGQVVAAEIGLRLLAIFHNSVHQDAWQGDVTRGNCARFQHVAHLNKDLAAAIMCRQRHRVAVHIDGFFFQADVAARVGIGPAHNGVIHGERAVAQFGFAIDLDKLHQIFAGDGIGFAAVVTWVNERAEANVGDKPRTSGADLAQQRLDHPAGEAIGFNLFVLHQRLHLGRPGKMAGNHPF